MELLVDRLPDEIEQAIKALLEEASRRSLSLATAESCTGGLLAALLTDVEGYGHVFERGFVVYSEEAKVGMLGIDRALIDTQGAVSKAVALAMAKGALAHCPADVVLAITGFAGAGGPDDEAGLVHFACARRGRQPVHREEHLGDRGRAAVRLETVRIAVAMIREALA